MHLPAFEAEIQPLPGAAWERTEAEHAAAGAPASPVHLWLESSNVEGVVPAGFEPALQAPEAHVIGHYTTGLLAHERTPGVYLLLSCSADAVRSSESDDGSKCRSR